MEKLSNRDQVYQLDGYRQQGRQVWRGEMMPQEEKQTEELLLLTCSPHLTGYNARAAGRAAGNDGDLD